MTNVMRLQTMRDKRRKHQPDAAPLLNRRRETLRACCVRLTHLRNELDVDARSPS